MGGDDMKNQANGIGEYSTSPTGQGCLWVVAIGILAVLAFSYLSTYAGFPHDPLDRVDSGIAGVMNPTVRHRTKASRSTVRHHRRRVVYQSAE
jgi:hypothetical protein